jgi:hypothetical protein
LRVASILGVTQTYHLWHPPATTKPNQKWSEGENVAYLQRRGRLGNCMNGLHKRDWQHLSIRLVGTANEVAALKRLLPDRQYETWGASPVELEIAMSASPRFTKRALCNILISPSNISNQICSPSIDYQFPEHEHVAHDILKALGSVMVPKKTLTAFAA